MTEVLTGEVVDPLTDEEFADRERLETVITLGFGSFVEVGQALTEVNERRLYRDRHRTFVDYVEKTWQISESRAYQLINAAAITLEISTVVEEAPDDSPLRSTPLPQNESQARELTAYIGQPELAAEVLREAEQGGVPTAGKIKAAVKRRNPKTTTTTTVTTETVETEPAPARDRTPAEKRAADTADRAAQNFCQYLPQQVEERTVARLEAWCRKWRDAQ